MDKKYKCLWCGKEFQKKKQSNRGKYCSKECMHKGFSKQTQIMNLINNPSKNKEVRNKMSKTRKEKMANREIINWTEKGVSLAIRKKHKINTSDLWKDSNYRNKNISTKKKLFKEGKLKTSFVCGEKNPSWKGGITPLHREIRNSKKYKEWALFCLKRDKYSCKKCGNNKDLIVHHKNPFSNILTSNKIKTFNDAILCSEFWDSNNGITLCRNCHKKEHSK